MKIDLFLRCMFVSAILSSGTAAVVTSAQVPQTAQVSLASQGGLRRLTFDTLQGRVIVNLPDDMAAGDTISGTVIAEPKGTTQDERKIAAEVLDAWKIEIQGISFLVGEGMVRLNLPRETGHALNVILKDPKGSIIGNSNLVIVAVPVGERGKAGQLQPKLSFDPPRGSDAPAANVKANASDVSRGTSHTRAVQQSEGFHLPAIGQQGRPVEIYGPFDGNFENTNIQFRTEEGQTAESGSGSFGLRPIAESPRKTIFQGPTSFTGPVEISLQERTMETKGSYRNIGVRLSAPTTNLLKNQSVPLTTEVIGLEGLQKGVPLHLESQGVIRMEGGNFQNLLISPQDVQPGGRYTTTRMITGEQAGSFSASGTVVAGPFDFRLQDDVDISKVLLLNSFTGDYVFCCRPPVPPESSGNKYKTGRASQPGGTRTDPAKAAKLYASTYGTLTGTGKVTMKGCIITLQHNPPDRRVMGTVNACNRTGNATVQTSSPKWSFTLSDGDPN